MIGQKKKKKRSTHPPVVVGKFAEHQGLWRTLVTSAANKLTCYRIRWANSLIAGQPDAA